MNFWAPGTEAPGVDRDFEDEGVYIVNDSQTRMSIDQQVLTIINEVIYREEICQYTNIEERSCKHFCLSLIIL